MSGAIAFWMFYFYTDGEIIDIKKVFSHSEYSKILSNIKNDIKIRLVYENEID
jgi:hypothetical protein